MRGHCTQSQVANVFFSDRESKDRKGDDSGLSLDELQHLTARDKRQLKGG